MAAGQSAAQMRAARGLPDEPGGVCPPSTFVVVPSVAFPGMQAIIGGVGVVLADNQSTSDIASFNAMTDAQQASYLSHTSNSIKVNDPNQPRGSAQYTRRGPSPSQRSQGF